MKIICVMGDPKSGKSTALVQLLFKINGMISHRRSKGKSYPKDFTIILAKARKGKKSKSFPLGMASMGDDPGHILDYIKFFSGYPGLKVIVCASRKTKAYTSVIESWSKVHRATLKKIDTSAKGGGYKTTADLIKEIWSAMR